MNAKAKKLFGTIHLWMGLVVGIPAAILGATGIALMAVHPLPAEVGAAVPTDIDRTIELARTSVPGGATLQQYAPPEADGAPASVRFQVPRTPENPRGFKAVQVDSKTNTILPPPVPPMGWQRIVHDLHGNLIVEGRGGRQLVGWAGIVMTIMGLTGIVIWWPKPNKWHEAFTVKTTGTTRRLLHDLHGAAGIWGLVVFVVVSVTGVLISFPIGGFSNGGQQGQGGPGAGRQQQQENAAPGGARQQRGAEAATAGDHQQHQTEDGGARQQRGSEDVAVPFELHVDAAVATALKEHAGLGLLDVQVPRTAKDTYRIRVAPVGAQRSAPPFVITVSADAATVQSVRDPSDAPFNERLRAWNRALHMGMGLGWVWWILVLVSGVLPVLFAITGTWLWLIKRRNKAMVAAQQPAQ